HYLQAGKSASDAPGGEHRSRLHESAVCCRCLVFAPIDAPPTPDNTMCCTFVGCGQGGFEQTVGALTDPPPPSPHPPHPPSVHEGPCWPACHAREPALHLSRAAIQPICA